MSSMAKTWVRERGGDRGLERRPLRSLRPVPRHRHDRLGAHGEAALRAYPPATGERVLDIGCGFGDTTQRLAELVGPEGGALGVDVAERFIEAAREEAEEAGVDQRGASSSATSR